ncbi:AAA family ATPase [Lacihabitans sp. LS3-19]|uniref:AVAST type 2 anti-phage system protein Avs2 n=1 Tax=Lacihabitans sp. LS3-19 TaxID=2487335 RepID=UPI0020CED58F|nr:AVAST type 2 anti-phage system protein Avs2 [Lacihabitans sp. LS3-19]MCP9769124.1 AAA family ATPase [Lacihabitans sp. LS3-19]
MKNTYHSQIGNGSSKNVVTQGDNNDVKVFFNGEFEPSKEWFEHNLKVSISNLGVRHDNELNIELPILAYFDCIIRNQEFVKTIKTLLVNVHSSFNDLTRISTITAESSFLKIQKDILNLDDWYRRLEFQNMGEIKSLYILNVLKTILENLDILRDLFFHKHALEKQDPNYDRYSSVFRIGHYNINNFYHEILAILTFIESEKCRLSEFPFLLVNGEAGQGKSHLLADAALTHQQNGGASILLLGGDFSQEEFWFQVFRFLGISTSCVKNDVLKKLNEFAEQTQKRLLFCIDALNEGQAKIMWAGILSGIIEDIKPFKHLSLILSVRSNYEDLIIPTNLKDSFISITHKGFGNLGYQAINSFFKHHKLELPSIPLMNPEFNNPLFLKLFCVGLNNLGLTKISEGANGISKIIDLFLNGLNTSIYKKYEVPLKLNISQRCADLIAKFLAENKANFIHFDEAFILLNTELSVFFSGGLPKEGILQLFLSEGLLRESRQLNNEKNELVDSIEFNYERFGDHRQVSYFINNYFTYDINPFDKGGKLEYILNEKHYYPTLIAALAIELPEKLGKEQFEYLPEDLRNDGYIFYNFLDSLKWREAKSITDRTLGYLRENQVINLGAVLETILSVTNRQDHPLNSDFLHNRLINMSMAERDDIWTKHIFYEYSHKPDYKEGVSYVQRLIDWAWSDDLIHYDDSSIYLSAKTTIWFFTCPNNTLRDSATKAVVCLLTNRTGIAERLLFDFKDVNDPYVLERFLASCYGAITRSTNINQSFVQKVYDLYFDKQNPPTHVLSRDYARGIVEFSNHFGIKINGSISNIYPPYKSDWPKQIMAEKRLKIKYYNDDIHENNRKAYAQNFVYNLVMNPISDYFKSEIQNLKFSSISFVDEELYKSFVKTLNTNKRKAVKVYKNICESINKLKKYKGLKVDVKNNSLKIYESLLNKDIGLNEVLSTDEFDYFKDKIKPYLLDLRNSNEGFPTDIIQRYILQMVFKLGWTSELFGEFDYKIERSILNRNQDKSKENFGQKYINIAYFDCLARLSDKYYYQNPYKSGDSLNYILKSANDILGRNIDPTVIEKVKEDTVEKNGWWFNYSYNKWNVPYSEWITLTDDLPKISDILDLIDKANNNWLMLQGFPVWKENSELSYQEKETFIVTSDKEIWYHLRSYIIKKDDLNSFQEWGKNQNFMETKLSEGTSINDIYSLNFFWSKEYFEYLEIKEGNKISYKPLGENGNCPFKGIITTDEYSWSNSEDYSLAEGLRYNLPSNDLKNLLDIETKNGFEYFNASSNLICLDPSVKQKGLKCLLVKKDEFLEILDKKNLSIVWTVLGEKIGFNDYQTHGRLDISGCYYLNEEGKIEGSFNFSQSSN